MNDDTVEDLKQFIAATVRQETKFVVREELSTVMAELSALEKGLSAVQKDIARLDKKIDDRIDEVLAAVRGTMNPRFEVVEVDLEQLNTRATKHEAA